MRPIRSLAAGLLFLTGAFHLISVMLGKFEPTSTITLVFGVIVACCFSLIFRKPQKEISQ